MDLLEVSKEELIEVLIEKGKKIDELRKRCDNLEKTQEIREPAHTLIKTNGQNY